MRTKRVAHCVSCNSRLNDESLCPDCGYPTRNATDDERIEWEIRQWRTAHSPPAPDPPPHATDPPPQSNGMPVVRRRSMGRPPPEPTPLAPTILPASPRRMRFRDPGERHPAAEQPEGIVIDLRAGATFAVHGRSGLRPATLRVAQAAITLEPRLFGRIRWIPLDEVERIESHGGALELDSSVERIRLHADASTIERTSEAVRASVAEARRGGRHDPDVTQAWIELVSDLWKTKLSRVRVWVRKRVPLG